MHKIFSNSLSFESLHDKSIDLNTCNNISQSPYFKHTTMAINDHNHTSSVPNGINSCPFPGCSPNKPCNKFFW